MATYDQEYRLGVRVDSSTVDPATAKVRALWKEMKEVEASTTFSGRSARMAELSKEINAAERSMAKFKTTATQVGQAGQQIQQGTGRGAMGMLTLANSMQDFQSAGLRGILNNIPMLVTAIGGGAGLAGTVMIAAVAFEALKGAMGGFKEEAGERYESDQFRKLAEDAKKATDAIFGLSDAQQQANTDMQNTLRNAPVIGGGPGGASGIAAALAARTEARTGLAQFEDRAEESVVGGWIEGGKSMIGLGKAPVDQNELRRRAQEHFENQIRILAADPKRAKELEALVATVSPETAAKLPGAKQEMTVGTPEMAAAAQRKYIREQEKLVDDLNKQGQENERLGIAIKERTEAEIRAKESVERHTRTERQAQLIKESGGGPIPFLAEQIAGMTLGKQYGGQGLEMGQALDVTRQQIAQQAMYSRINGGLGMNAESAMAFATQQVNAAYGDAANMAAMQKQMFPEAAELAKQQGEANTIYKNMLTQGVPIRVRKVGHR